MTLATTVGAPTHGGANIRAATVTTASTQIADDTTPAKTSISVGAGARVVLQVVGSGIAGAGWTAGSVYLTADAGGGAMVPTSNACTFGRAGTGILDLMANYDCEVGAETGVDFAGQVSVLLKTVG